MVSRRCWAAVGQGARVAGVDEAQVGPVEGAGGFAAVGGDELDGDPPGGVVEGGDGADVVPVGRADLAADPDVPGDVVDAGDPLGEVGAVEAVGVGGDPLRGHGDGEVGFEVGEGDGAGEAVDAVDVGVEAVGELLGVGAADALDQLVAGVGGFVVRGREPGVVAFQLHHGVVVELGGFGIGEHQPVLRRAAGQLDVGAFAVEAVGADADGQVPGAALGPVGGQRVGVGEVPAPAQVPVGEHQLGTAIQTDGEPAGVDGGDVAGLPVGDLDRVAVDGVFGAVAPHDDPLTDPERPRPEPDGGAVEFAGVGEAGDDGLVEPLDEVVGAGQQHR